MNQHDALTQHFICYYCEAIETKCSRMKYSHFLSASKAVWLLLASQSNVIINVEMKQCKNIDRNSITIPNISVYIYKRFSVGDGQPVFIRETLDIIDLIYAKSYGFCSTNEGKNQKKKNQNTFKID